MTDTVRLRSSSVTAHITSPPPPCPAAYPSSSYYSPAKSKGDDQSGDGSPLTASLWKRRLNHARREQEEMATELQSARKQLLDLQRQLASERARIGIDDRRQQSKEAEREVQQLEIHRRLNRLLSLVTATEGKLSVKPKPLSKTSSPSSPLSHLTRGAGVTSEGSSSSLEGLARELERRVGEVLVMALEAHGDLLIAKASTSSPPQPWPSSTFTPVKSPHPTTSTSQRQNVDSGTSPLGRKVPSALREEPDDEPADQSVPVLPSPWKPRVVSTPVAPIDQLSLKSQGASAAFGQAFVHAASAPGMSPLSSTSASKALSEVYASAQSASASKPSLLSSSNDKGTRALSPPTLRSSSYSPESSKTMSNELSLSQVGESTRAKSFAFADIYSSPKIFISKEGVK